MGLSKYNPQLDNFDNFTFDENNEGSLLDNTIWNIYEDRLKVISKKEAENQPDSESKNINENILWVATSEGIHKYDPLNNQFVRTKIRQPNNISVNLAEIRNIFHDNEGNYWFNSYVTGFQLPIKIDIIE